MGERQFLEAASKMFRGPRGESFESWLAHLLAKVRRAEDPLDKILLTREAYLLLGEEEVREIGISEEEALEFERISQMAYSFRHVSANKYGFPCYGCPRIAWPFEVYESSLERVGEKKVDRWGMERAAGLKLKKEVMQEAEKWFRGWGEKYLTMTYRYQWSSGYSDDELEYPFIYGAEKVGIDKRDLISIRNDFLSFALPKTQLIVRRMLRLVSRESLTRFLQLEEAQREELGKKTPLD